MFVAGRGVSFGVIVDVTDEYVITRIERVYEDSRVCLIIKPLAGKTNMDEFLKYYTNFIPQIKKEFQKTQV